jgi:hypothetical protein
MNTQHTPAPWHIGESNPWLVYAADGYAVADTRTYHGRHADTKADARLIAAAPEMLHALQYQLDLMQWIETADTESPFYEQTMTLRLNTGRDYMELAIAKAIGKETA